MAPVKSNFEDDIRRFSLPDSSTFADLTSTLSSLYSLEGLVVKYRDEEGDLVTIASDAELASAVAGASSSLLRLTVMRPPSAQQATPAAAPAVPAPAAAGTSPNGEPDREARPDTAVREGPETVMEGLGELFQSMFSPMSSGFRGGPMRDWPGQRGQCQGQRSRRGGCGAQRGRGGRSEGWGARCRARCANLRASFHEINPEVAGALKTLLRYIKDNSTPPAAMSALPGVVPLMFSFVSGSLGQSGAVPQEAVDSFIADMAAAVTPHLGAPIAERVSAFLREALADADVVAFLRQLAGMRAELPDFGAAAGNVGRAAGRAISAAGRLDVHHDVACDGCDMEPLVGTRHKCMSRPNFDLCSACMADPAVDKAGLEFRAIEFPWEVEGTGRRTPRPTLGFRARGVEVMMLQKILTDLGFMTPDMYRFGAGTYGPNTARAVNQFRERYGLGTVGPFGVYDNVAAASLASLLESSVPPTATAGPGAPAASSPAPASPGDHPAAA